MHQSVLDYAAQCYGIAASQLTPLTGGHVTHVYQFSRDNADYVLRITPPGEELDIPAMQSILAWMHFLAAHGASVSGPVLSCHNRLIEIADHDRQSYVIVAFDKARGVLAEELRWDQWNHELYRTLGRTVGRLHALARRYSPPDDSLRRPAWDRTGNCFNPERLLDPSQALVEAKRERVFGHVQALPKEEDGYGLVHADLHGGNFFVDCESGPITVFDFDDCCYGWYVMDVAMGVFDMLVLYPGSDKEAFAARFLKSYLSGYRSENDLNPFWLRQLPQFLKLLEIGVYAQVYQYYDPNEPDSWIGKFMANRKYRIENDVPYVAIDVAEILASTRHGGTKSRRAASMLPDNCWLIL